MNRKEFFAQLRRRDSGVFGTRLTQGQVDGTEALLDVMEGWSLPHVAHVLAEVYHETGRGMMPVKETVFPGHKDKNPSDAEVIRRLDRAWARGQLTWVKEPYWRDGWFGRGQIQITWEDNYVKASALTGVDLISHPEKALDLKISAKIAAYGCQAGMFRGRKLSDYDGLPYRHADARNIVNGDARKVGPEIEQIALAFEKALKAGQWGLIRPIQRPNPSPAGGRADRALTGRLPWWKRIFGGRR